MAAAPRIPNPKSRYATADLGTAAPVDSTRPAPLFVALAWTLNVSGPGGPGVADAADVVLVGLAEADDSAWAQISPDLEMTAE
ncbi:MAG: hypothetical protein M1820_005831 [Bogoriella megaspora]|nr:MAG: hypothetical protein M1820_005831 [Bogoriella megaspora]